MKILLTVFSFTSKNLAIFLTGIGSPQILLAWAIRAADKASYFLFFKQSSSAFITL